MLNSKDRYKLLTKLDNLIPEKKESEKLKEEFLNWINSGEPFFKSMNESERELFKKYPDLIIKKELSYNFYYDLRYKSEKQIGEKVIFNFNDRLIFEEDNRFDDFFIFNFTTYPAFFDIIPYNNIICNDLGNIISDKLINMFQVRKKYLEKRMFIRRVLDSKDLTLTYLKKNYNDIYKLLKE